MVLGQTRAQSKHRVKETHGTNEVNTSWRCRVQNFPAYAIENADMENKAKTPHYFKGLQLALERRSTNHNKQVPLNGFALWLCRQHRSCQLIQGKSEWNEAQEWP